MMAHFKTIQNASKFKKLSKYLYLQCQQNLKVVNPQILQNIDRAKTLTLEYHHVLYLIPFNPLTVSPSVRPFVRQNIYGPEGP